MATTFDKDMNIITNFLKDMDIIAALDDQPNDVGGLTAAELKAKFDEGGKAIQTYINETLIPEVLGLDSTESARQQAETGRAQAETVRAQAETERAQAEAARTSAESARAAAEQTRMQNETARIAAETARAQAEQQRADETAGIVARATAQANTATQQATAASGSASAAAASASTASEKAAGAGGSAAAAAASAAAAARSERLAESWAVGGTGQREGEDTDNARYWAGMAHTAAGGGVLSFHGRTGVVVPANDDYTAEMVGAIPAAQRGVADGIATLGTDGKVPFQQLPDRLSLRPCQVVVGTSAAGWTAQECDFLCDGTDDQEEILAAIAALPESGGTVLLLEGTYNTTAQIEVSRSHVTIRGMSSGVTIHPVWSDVDNTFKLKGDYNTLSHLRISGSEKSDSISPGGIWVGGTRCTVEWVNIDRVTTGLGIDTGGTYFVMQNCVVPSPVDIAESYCSLLFNTFIENDRGVSDDLFVASSYNKVIGNILNSGFGITVGGYYNVVADNSIETSEEGCAISLYGEKNICRNNFCAFRNDSGAYAGKTLELHASHSIVTGNIFLLKDLTEAGGADNLVADNLTVVG